MTSPTKLPFPPEICSLILTQLTNLCPTKIILLSKYHYKSVIPSIYQSINISSDTLDELLYGVEIIENADRTISSEGRKADACAYVGTIYIKDKTSWPIADQKLTLMQFLEDNFNNERLSPVLGLDSIHHGPIEKNEIREIIFPNLNKIVIHKSTFDLSEEYCEIKSVSNMNKIRSISKFTPIKKEIYLDFPFHAKNIQMSNELLYTIILRFKPNSLMIKLSFSTYLSMLCPYINKVPHPELYVDFQGDDNHDEEDEAKKEKRRKEIYMEFRKLEWRILTYSRVPSENPLKVYLKDQNLIDYIIRKGMAAPQNENKTMRIYHWDKEDDWLE